jgi:flagellar biosynthesis/type III secretory pathway protein FliH
MTREEAKSCIGTIEMLQRLAYNIHGVMDVIDADNCKKIIKALEQEPCEDEIILAKEEYGRLLSNEFDNGYAKGYREALEQDSILDKIKAEIQNLRNCSCSCSDGIIDDVEDIIEKCKAGE